MKKILAATLMLLTIYNTQAQEEIALYSNIIPNSKPTTKKQREETGADGKLRIYDVVTPTLTVYPAPKEKSNGTSIIICPGGGYRLLAASHEGSDVAKAFNAMGITAFVLKYRLPDDEIMNDKTMAPLMDVQRAIQLVRDSVKKWALNAKKIGLMGFSAGGHLAATAITHFDKNYIDNPKNTSLRPDFAVLVYPVVTFMEPTVSKGSRETLLGKTPEAGQLKFFSGEVNVTKKTPPTFLVHAKDDTSVKIENSTQFMDALNKNNIKNGEYFYDSGGHGFGMNNPGNSVKWMTYLQQWLFDMEIISKKY
jgi:acetyl esterase/lipase